MRRAEFIRSRQASYSNSTNVTREEYGEFHQHRDEQITSSDHDWVSGFHPRQKIEIVRNCAALPRDFVDGVVLKVANALLGLSVETRMEEEEQESKSDRKKWNIGGEKSLAFFFQ